MTGGNVTGTERVRLGLAMGLALVALLVSSWPALMGSWVYDDLNMLEHPLMDDLGDAWAVFSRTSGDYLSDPGPGQGRTYRPLSAFSLILVQALAPGSPLPHHLLSLLLHGLAAWLLWRALSQASGRSRWWWGALAFLWAVHPAHIESYAWINGRSDVLAGAFVIGVAALLPWQEERSSTVRKVSLALCAMGAALAKEPGAVAVLFVVAACFFPVRGWPTRARVMACVAPAAAACVGLALAYGLRLSAMPKTSASTGTVLAQMTAQGHALLRLHELALESWFVPLPRAMPCLATEIRTPASITQLALLLAVAALAVLFALRRYGSALVLWLGAALVLSPSVLVSSWLWLGLDRYLYVPSLLACLALARLGLPEPRGRMVLWVSVPAIAACVWASHVTAEGYVDQHAFARAITLAHPQDPAAYIITADLFVSEGHPELAREALRSAPTDPLPAPGLVPHLVQKMLDQGLVPQATSLIERFYAAEPGFVPALPYLASLRLEQRRYDEAFEMAERVAAHPTWCSLIVGRLENWKANPLLPAEQQARARTLLAAASCR